VISYLIKKIGYGLSVLFGVVCLVFLIFNLKPGDPATMLAGQQVSKESLEAIRKELNYDLPKSKRFLIYLFPQVVFYTVKYHRNISINHYLTG